jgi:hypothetical protein
MTNWLNAREQAAALWLAGIVAFGLFKSRDARLGVLALAVSVLNPKLGGVILAAAVYAASTMALLARLGVADETLFKAAVYWFFGTALVALANLPGKDGAFLKKLIRELFSVAFVVAFVVNLYVFPLYVELVVVPVVLLTTIAKARRLLIVLGAVVLAIVVARVAFNLGDYATWATARAYLLPIALTVAFVPFLYVFALVMAYELVFMRLGFALRDEDGRTHAPFRVKLAAMRAAGARLSRINRFSPAVMPQACAAESEEDVLAAIERFRDAA